tara:strand:- start:2030 stop:2239 length:210 start_codon:yes stop_codon:yes gene_type:complete
VAVPFGRKFDHAHRLDDDHGRELWGRYADWLDLNHEGDWVMEIIVHQTGMNVHFEDQQDANAFKVEFGL